MSVWMVLHEVFHASRLLRAILESRSLAASDEWLSAEAQHPGAGPLHLAASCGSLPCLPPRQSLPNKGNVS